MSASPGLTTLWTVPETIMSLPGTMSPHSFLTLISLGGVVSSSLPQAVVSEPQTSWASSSGLAGTGGIGPLAASAASLLNSMSSLAPAGEAHAVPTATTATTTDNDLSLPPRTLPWQSRPMRMSSPFAPKVDVINGLYP